jgi:hypothetical protein
LLAVACICVATGGCATQNLAIPAQPIIKDVNIDVLPRGTMLPENPFAACVPRNRFVVCVSEEPIEFTRSDPQQVGTVNWHVQTGGWTLVGIDIKGSHRWQMSSNPRGIAASNTKDGRTYRYTITVTNGTDTLQWDPFIVND